MAIRSRWESLVVRCLTLAAMVLLASPSIGFDRAQLTGTVMEVEVQDQEESMPIKAWLTEGHMRLDIGDQASMISIGGEAAKMMVIMHARQQYMEFNSEMLNRMAMMAGPRAPAGTEAEESGPPPRFVVTGNTKSVGAWDAYEVRVEVEDDPGQVMMWFSEDVDADFAQVVADLAAGFESMNNPMTQRMDGGFGDALGTLHDIQSAIDAMDVPAGFPVQLITTEEDGTTTLTLQSIEQGAVDASAFEPPEGYQKVDMPFGN